jgi:hypothetical protein
VKREEKTKAEIFKRRFYYALPFAGLSLVLIDMSGVASLGIASSLSLKGMFAEDISRSHYLRSLHGGFYKGHFYLVCLLASSALSALAFFKITLPGIKIPALSAGTDYRAIFAKFDLITVDREGNETVPKIVDKQEDSFVIKDCQADKNLNKYLNGLIETLNDKKIISFKRGELKETGYPGRYIIERVSGNQTDVPREFFLESGWFRKEIVNGISKTVYPSVQTNREEETVTLDLKGVKLTGAKINKHLDLFEKHIGFDLDAQYKLGSKKLTFKILKELPKMFEKGDVNFNFDKWYESVVVPMKEFEHEHWFCGEVNDPNVKFEKLNSESNALFYSIPSSSHAVVIGNTGSGKTKTLVHMCVSLAAAYPKAQWVFGDGKSGADLSPVADRLSDYSLAIQDGKTEDVGIQFANIVNVTWREYERRQALWAEAKELGYNPSTYLDLRRISEEIGEPKFYLEKFFLVIDELKAYWSLSCGDPNKFTNESGTIPNMLSRLLAETRSYGISLILCSQNYKYDTFPTKMRSNLTTQLVHKQEIKDCDFIEIPEAHSLARGEFYLRGNGLMDMRGKSLFKMQMPYIGDDPEKVLDKLGFEKREHKEWDYDLIYNRGGGLDFDKMDILQLSKIIRQAFLKREGYEITEKHGSDEKYLSTFLHDPGRDIDIAVGIIKSEDTDIDILKNNIQIECENSSLTDSPKVFFVFGEKTISKWKEILNVFYSFNAVIISQTQYSKLLRQAYNLYRSEDDKYIFRRLLKYLLDEQGAAKEAQIDNMYGGESNPLEFFAEGASGVGSVNEMWGTDNHLIKRDKEAQRKKNKGAEEQEGDDSELPDVAVDDYEVKEGPITIPDPIEEIEEIEEETLTEEPVNTDTEQGNGINKEESAPDSDRDEMYQDAIGLIFKENAASASMIQRKLRIGYKRASNIVKALEEEGYIGPQNGTKPREVIVSKKRPSGIKQEVESVLPEANTAPPTNRRNTPYKDNLNLETLDKILKIKKNADKGDAAEQFVIELERYFEHDTVFMRELIYTKQVKFQISSGKADGGIDLIRWVDRKKKQAIAIQVKAQPSRKIGTGKIDELVGCANKFTDIEFVGFVFYNVDGYFSRACKNYNNVQMIDRDAFRLIVKKIKGQA